MEIQAQCAKISRKRDYCIAGAHITTSLCIIEKQAIVMPSSPLMYIYVVFFFSCAVGWFLF